MVRTYYSRVNYDEQLKKQYIDEFLKRKQYLENLRKKQYEEYLKRKEYEECLRKKKYEKFIKRKKALMESPKKSKLLNYYKLVLKKELISSSNQDKSHKVHIPKEPNNTNNINIINANTSTNTSATNTNNNINTTIDTTKQNQYIESKYESPKKTYKRYNYNNIEKKHTDKGTIELCKTTVSSEARPLQENFPYTSEVTKGPITVKIPVVLTECTITITIESILKLQDAVSEIKHVSKNVYLDQCKFIPNSETVERNTGILFLGGFIRKNIEYSTKECTNNCSLCGKIKDTSIDIPFKCTTRVKLNTPPKFKENTFEEEVEILQSCINTCDLCEENLMGKDFREKNFRLLEFFNEKIFCDLISAEFIESDILENPIEKDCKLPLNQTFHDIKEKAVLLLTIKLTQAQNVELSK